MHAIPCNHESAQRMRLGCDPYLDQGARYCQLLLRLNNNIDTPSITNGGNR